MTARAAFRQGATSIGRMLRTALSWLRHRASKLSRPFGFNRFRVNGKPLPKGWREIGSETALRVPVESFDPSKECNMFGGRDEICPRHGHSHTPDKIVMPPNRSSRVAFAVEETPPEVIEALRNADYSALPKENENGQGS